MRANNRETPRGGVSRTGPDRFGIYTYRSSRGIAFILQAYAHIDSYEAIDAQTLITDWECL